MLLSKHLAGGLGRVRERVLLGSRRLGNTRATLSPSYAILLWRKSKGSFLKHLGHRGKTWVVLRSRALAQ